MFHGEVLFIGGKVSPKHSRVSGSISQQVIQQFHFHKAFVSIDGLLPGFGVSSFELEKGETVRSDDEISRENIYFM